MKMMSYVKSVLNIVSVIISKNEWFGSMMLSMVVSVVLELDIVSVCKGMLCWFIILSVLGVCLLCVRLNSMCVDIYNCVFIDDKVVVSIMKFIIFVLFVMFRIFIICMNGLLFVLVCCYGIMVSISVSVQRQKNISWNSVEWNVWVVVVLGLCVLLVVMVISLILKKLKMLIIVLNYMLCQLFGRKLFMFMQL